MAPPGFLGSLIRVESSADNRTMLEGFAEFVIWMARHIAAALLPYWLWLLGLGVALVVLIESV